MAFACLVSSGISVAQQPQKFSSVNPALFLYASDDVYVCQPDKYDKGRNIISPNPKTYPWEAKLENGMPNVLRDNDGNLSLYLSCFLVHSDVPFSKVGAFVYTNNSSNLTQWTRPEAGLYWYNSHGKSVDEKISPTPCGGCQASNIVAVDIESLGIFDDTDVGIEKPIKLVYLPQREKENRLIAGYEMRRDFTSSGVLSGFADMKADRVRTQHEYLFRFINADTHMNYLKQGGKYYVVSRINAKRSSLLPGEKLPFPSPDPRMRYRRETVTELGGRLESGNYDIDVALDMSTRQWEPYSMQPFRLDGFEDDIWWGLVTAFGTRADEKVANRQRTELAFSNNALDWYYVKPGSPFIDNGEDPHSDDHGCINVAKPIRAGRYSANPDDLLYFYAASRQLHVSERNSGISLAVGRFGKWAGLSANGGVKTFYSADAKSKALVTFSLYAALGLEASYAPQILADVTQDPRGRQTSQLDSYVNVSLYSYDPTKEHGLGMPLAGAMGSSVKGTSKPSDQYESVGVVDGVNMCDKNLLFKFLKDYSDKNPTRVISVKDDMTNIPVVMSAKVKNATFYGFMMEMGRQTGKIIKTEKASATRAEHYWAYSPAEPRNPCKTISFAGMLRRPNMFVPTGALRGTVAVSSTPQASAGVQTLVRFHGDDANNICLSYEADGAFSYRIMMHGQEFARVAISPPKGQTFAGKETVVTVEALKTSARKYGKVLEEDVVTLRVSCPSISFEAVEQQAILWQWKHQQGHVTPSDSANARAFAYVGFSGFVPEMDKISIGASDEKCAQRFLGTISHVEVADVLPKGNSDFWDR